VPEDGEVTRSVEERSTARTINRLPAKCRGRPAPGCRYRGGEYELYVLTADWRYVSGGTVTYRNWKKVVQAANAWNGSGMRVFIVTRVAA
jgi:hypothetical protein